MKILFLCVANSARSQMAEGFGRRLLKPGVIVQSAGSYPSFVNPFAIKVMLEIGVDISEHTSKSVDSVALADIDLVITLCAEEICPVVPGRVKKLHWPIPDPAIQGGSDEDKLRSFRAARDAILERIEGLAMNLRKKEEQ